MKLRRVCGSLALPLSLTVLSACAQHAARTAAPDRTDTEPEAARAREFVDGFVREFVESMEAELGMPLELDGGQRESLLCLGRFLVDEVPLSTLERGILTPQGAGEAETPAERGARPDPATVDAFVRGAASCQSMSAVAGPFVELILHVLEVELGDTEFVSDRTRRCMREHYATGTTVIRILLEGATGVRTMEAAARQLSHPLLAACPSFIAEAILHGMELGMAQGGVELTFGESARVCFEGVLTRQDGMLASALEGFTGEMTDSSEALLNEAIVSCPEVFAGVLISELESDGVPVSDAARACLTRELALRPEAGEAALMAEEEGAPSPLREVVLTCVSEHSRSPDPPARSAERERELP